MARLRLRRPASGRSVFPESMDGLCPPPMMADARQGEAAMQPMRGNFRDYLERHATPILQAARSVAEVLLPREDGMSLRDADIPPQRQVDAMKAIFDSVVDEMALRHPHVPREVLAEDYRKSRALHQLVSAVQNYWLFAINDEVYGRKTFHVGGNLAERLANTELKVPSELLRPPFGACMFVFDDPVTRKAIADVAGVGGIQDDPVSVIVGMVDGEKGPTLGVMAAQANARSGKASRMLVRRLLLAPGSSVEDALRSTWEPDPGGNMENDEMFFGPGLRFMRIVANSLLYLASSSPDVSGELRAADKVLDIHAGASSKARKEHDRLKRSFAADPYIEVGASIPPLDAGSGPSSPLETRFLVRGHWRNQAHGPGMSERKLIRIEPHWKGPDMADIVSNDYRMGL